MQSYMQNVPQTVYIWKRKVYIGTTEQTVYQWFLPTKFYIGAFSVYTPSTKPTMSPFSSIPSFRRMVVFR